MRSGNRDYYLELRQPVEGKDVDLSVTKSYTHFAYCWGKRLAIKGDEKILAQQNLGTQIVSWQIPFVMGFNKKFGIVDDAGAFYNIFDMSPVGRNEGWNLVCVQINES